MSDKPSPEDIEREQGEERSAISNARAYTAPGVTVLYERGRYLHFAECVGCLRSSTPRRGPGSSLIKPLRRRWQR